MKLFNTMTNQVETFIPIKENEVSMYVCGPTVYNHAHIGNARPIIVFDTLRRLFISLGYSVKYVSNYTDVDDKIIKKAIEENSTEEKIASFYIDAYKQVRNDLNALEPTATPKVTQCMEDIIQFIDDLIRVNVAYEHQGDVYFRVDSVESYGMLSNQKKKDLQVGARIDENLGKENPLDFTLWKKTDVGIQWSSPWGMGRPGWHTECVVMIRKEFDAKMIDIHAGGMDLKFPHHENEIAQAMALYNHTIAQFWLHNGMLNIDGEKMSKSLGNVWWAKDVIQQLGPDVVRWVIMSSHYRAPLNISEEVIDQAKTELNKIYDVLKKSVVKCTLANIALTEKVETEYIEPFIYAMQDDLNTPNAYMAINELVKKINQQLRDPKSELTTLCAMVVSLEMMLWVLGIPYQRVELSKEDVELFALWNQAKFDKDYQKADQYRQQLIESGLL